MASSAIGSLWSASSGEIEAAWAPADGCNDEEARGSSTIIVESVCEGGIWFWVGWVRAAGMANERVTAEA